MPRYRVTALTPIREGVASSVEVLADTRSRAITKAAHALNVHRNLILSVENLNPSSGGGSKRG
jgi:hypothetical protein